MNAFAGVPPQQQLLQHPPPQQGRGNKPARSSGSGNGRGRGASVERKHLHESSKGSAYGTAGGAKRTSKSQGDSKPTKSFEVNSLKDFVRWLETSDDTDPAHMLSWCCDEFKPRKIKAPVVLGWLILQLLGLAVQLSLYLEIQGHLYEFEATIAAYCGPEHRQHDVCLGPAWNLSYSGVLAFPPTAGDDSASDFDFVIPSDRPFAFDISSTPPTFLMGIEPLPPNDKAQWKVALGPTGVAAPGSLLNSGIAPIVGTGKRYRVISHKHHHAFGRSQRWTASASLRSKYSESVHIHVYVVDSRIQHLDDIHKQEQCSFEDSWQNFNERHNGEHHKVFTFTKVFMGFALLLSLLFIAVVLHRFFFYVEGGKLLSRIIALKFLWQDIPQQLCIVAYLYGWYAPNGLRCQMCLFHPQHCDNEHPLHRSNVLVAIFTMISACSNQMLVQAKIRSNRDEEDECFLWFVRFALISVSILPFTTAVFLLAASFHLRSVFVYIICLVPALLGWGTVLCVPVFALCDDEDC